MPFTLAPALPSPRNSLIEQLPVNSAQISFSTKTESGPLEQVPSVIPLEVSAEPEIAAEVPLPKTQISKSPTCYKPSKFVTPKTPSLQRPSPLPPLEALVLDSDELTVEDLSRPSTR